MIIILNQKMHFCLKALNHLSQINLCPKKLLIIKIIGVYKKNKKGGRVVHWSLRSLRVNTTETIRNYTFDPKHKTVMLKQLSFFKIGISLTFNQRPTRPFFPAQKIPCILIILLTEPYSNSYKYLNSLNFWYLN